MADEVVSLIARLEDEASRPLADVASAAESMASGVERASDRASRATTDQARDASRSTSTIRGAYRETTTAAGDFATHTEWTRRRVGTSLTNLVRGPVRGLAAGFRTSFAQARDELERTERSSSNLRRAMGLAAGAVAAIGFGSLIKEAAVASDATDKFRSTMNFAGLKTDAIQKATKDAQAYADQTVYDLPTIQATMAQLASNGIKDYTALTQAAGNLNAVAGGNAETFKSVSTVMTQTAGAGKLTTENWNQLSDAIPGAAGPLSEALKKAGAYTGNFREAMEKGEISADEFNKAMTLLGENPAAVEAAKSTKTLEGAWGNFQATIVGGMTSVINTIKPSLTSFITLLSDGLGKAFDAIRTGVGAATMAFQDFDSVGWDVTSSGLNGWFERLGNVFGFVKQALSLVTTGFQTAGSVSYGVATGIGGLNSVFLRFGGTARATVTWVQQNADLIKALAVGVVAAAAAYKVASAGIAIFNGVMKAAAIVQRLFNTAVSANPLMKIIVVVAALAAGLGYFFTQTETGKALWQSLSATFAQFAPVVQQIQAALAPLLTQFAAMASTIAAQLAPVLVNLAQQLFPVLINLVNTLAPIFLNIVTTVLPPLAKILGIVAVSVGKVLVAVAPLIATVAELAGKIIGALTPILPPLASLLGKIATVVAKVAEALAPVISKVADLVVGLLEKLTPVLQPLIELIGKLATWIGDTLGGAMDGVMKFISPVVDALGWIADNAGKAMESLGDFASNPLGGVQDMLGIPHAGGGVVGFAGGGVVPGYAPGRDTVPAVLSRGEGVLVPEAVRALGSGWVYAMNKHFSGGRAPGESDPGIPGNGAALAGAPVAVPSGPGTVNHNEFSMSFGGGVSPDEAYAAARRGTLDALAERDRRAYVKGA